MTIKRKLWIISLSLAGIGLIMSAVFYSLLKLMDEADRKEFTADRIVMDVSDLNTLTYDYVMNPGERVVQQWKLKHASLENRVTEATSGLKNDLVLNRIKKNHQEALVLFDRLIEISSRNRHVPFAGNSMQDENAERLVSQLINRSQMMIIDAHELVSVSNTRIRAVRTIILNATSGLILTLTVLWFALVYLISRSIITAVQEIKKGTQVIAGGDLSYRLSLKGKDELTELAVSFNEMTRRLQETYSSLNSEIRERKKTEEALIQSEVRLQKSHSELERRVEERTADLRKAAEQLESANSELEAFSYSVSHDLRGPVRIMDGFTKMILEDFGQSMDKELRRRFDIIRESATKMDRLIDDLLTLSRLGRKEIFMRSFDMKEVVLDSWQEITSLEKDRKIELNLMEMPAAYGDRSLIRQIVLNLLSNAVKFTKDREKPSIEVGGYTEDGSNIFYVKDNGAGFNMKYYDKLFRVFQRLHGEEYEGTGIGLAIVQRITKRHGGEVWAEGEEGRGATFYFSLPAGQ